MISVADLEVLTFDAFAALAGLVWCVVAVRMLPRSMRDAGEGIVAVPAVLFVGHLGALWLLLDLPRPQGDLWQQQLITSTPMAVQATLGVALLVLELVVAALLVLSFVPLAIGVQTWWTASDADGPWEGITYGTRARRRWWSWYYQQLLTRQVKAYARVQGGRTRTVAVERVFHADEASTTLRIQPLLSVPLSLGKQVFPALRWSSRVQHNGMGATTFLEVHWDLAAIDRGPLRRWSLAWTRRHRRVNTAVALTAALVAVAVAASAPWAPTESARAGSAAALQRSLVYAANLPGADPGLVARTRPDLPGPAPAWAVDEVDLATPSHSELCRPSEQGATAGGHCEAVTTFTPDHPITITAVGVAAYGVMADRAVRLVAWEFDTNPTTRFIQSVGPLHAWQVIRLPAPTTASKVTATVLDAAQAAPTIDNNTDPRLPAGSYRLIGIDGQEPPSPAPPGSSKLAPTH